MSGETARNAGPEQQPEQRPDQQPGQRPGRRPGQPRERRYDVVVVGGGAAGLSGALMLARARRSVLVVDSGSPRNAPAGHAHNYLGREGAAPAELLADGRAEIAAYGGETVTGTVVAAERQPDGDFRVVLEDGTGVLAARLLVTTGLVDELPDVPGVAERWGRDVLHCPYCHGWEVRDRPLAVLATSPAAVHQALLWRQWSSDVTLFLHTAPDPDDAAYEQLAARGIALVDGKVTGLRVTDDRVTGVSLEGDRVIPCEAVVVAPVFTARAAVLQSLGLATNELERDGQVIGSYVAADPTGATDVPGVWAAGNVTAPAEILIGSAAAGARAAGAVNADLVAEDTRRAVAARERPAGGPGRPGAQPTDAEIWEDRYRGTDRVWSGEPNTALVKEVSGLPPGRALDLGCGEGGDAIWLARHGWRVTAADVSHTALERAARHAAEAGVADRVEWQRHDLMASLPEGVFDLVSSHFLHSEGPLRREEVLRAAVRRVAPGGVLLVVGHSGLPHWETPRPDVRLPGPDEVLDALGLPEGEWEVLVCAEHERVQNDPEGRPATRTDNTVKVRRLPAS